MGFDTVRLSCPITPGQWKAYRLNGGNSGTAGTGWRVHKNQYGTTGPVWWANYENDGTVLHFKGVGHDGWLSWEGSVPKFLGLVGPATAADVQQVASFLHHGTGGLMRTDTMRCPRVDITEDFYDPERRLIAAAVGWKPHPRTKYIQAVYQGEQTVMLRNTKRAIRVYDKELEAGPAYKDTVRLEYQLRSDWTAKEGLRDLRHLCDNVATRVMDPLKNGLLARAGMEVE